MNLNHNKKVLISSKYSGVLAKYNYRTGRKLFHFVKDLLII